MHYLCACSPHSPPTSLSGHLLLSPIALPMSSCSNMRDLRMRHSHLIRTGLAQDAISISHVLAFCAVDPAGDINYALQVFSRIPDPNAYSWNTIIRGLSRSSNPLLALELFVDMLHSPTQPQRLTFPSLFTAVAHLGLGGVDSGAQLHGMALKLGFAEDEYVRNSMMFMYGSCGRSAAASQLFDRVGCFDVVACNSMLMTLMRGGRITQARDLFEKMSRRSIATWSTMMSGYVRNGMFKEALALFGEMQQAGTEPNACVLVSLLSACAGLGALEQGEWAHSIIERREMQVNPIIVNALIDMYCKCGRLSKALEVFDACSKRVISSWNCVISGLAMHGQWEDAVGLFSQLQNFGLTPDNVTFVGILAACNHAGMVDEACHYFSRMIDQYGIEPTIEHYGCLVDALGRDGRLEEAVSLISKMPVEPDAAIWGSLLAACSSHGDTQMGARAARKVVELDPGDSGGYLLLANAYARAGEHGDAVSVRAAMGERGTRRKPGCSMIEVQGVVHEFVAGGTLHSAAEQIGAVLNHLSVHVFKESAAAAIAVTRDAESSCIPLALSN